MNFKQMIATVGITLVAGLILGLDSLNARILCPSIFFGMLVGFMLYNKFAK